jgi:hypothetical protein
MLGKFILFRKTLTTFNGGPESPAHVRFTSTPAVEVGTMRKILTTNLPCAEERICSRRLNLAPVRIDNAHGDRARGIAWPSRNVVNAGGK